MQRGLSQAEIDRLIDRYRDSVSIDGLARRYEVHRTTVIHHLDQARITPRRVARKMTDESVGLSISFERRG